MKYNYEVETAVHAGPVVVLETGVDLAASMATAVAAMSMAAPASSVEVVVATTVHTPK